MIQEWMIMLRQLHARWEESIESLGIQIIPSRKLNFTLASRTISLECAHE